MNDTTYYLSPITYLRRKIIKNTYFKRLDLELRHFIISIPKEKLQSFHHDNSQYITYIKGNNKIDNLEFKKSVVTLLNSLEGKFKRCTEDELDLPLNILYSIFDVPTNIYDNYSKLVNSLEFENAEWLNDVCHDLYFHTDLSPNQISDIGKIGFQKFKKSALAKDIGIRYYLADEYRKSADSLMKYFDIIENQKIVSEEVAWDYLLAAEIYLNIERHDLANAKIKKGLDNSYTVSNENKKEFTQYYYFLIIKSRAIELNNLNASIEQFERKYKAIKNELRKLKVLEYGEDRIFKELQKLEEIRISTFTKEVLPRLNSGSTLVYFASGPIVRANYKDLPYDNIFLIDYSFGKLLEVQWGKVFALRLDAIEAVNLFKALKIKIDCAVLINPGIFEGGGFYTTEGSVFQGLTLPLMADRVIYIGCKDYYSGEKYIHIREHYLDLPYQLRKELQCNDYGYISPKYFSSYDIAAKAKVFSLEKKSNFHITFDYKGLRVKIKHKSIYEDIEELDVAFVRYENKHQQEVIEKFEAKAYPIAVVGKSIDNITNSFGTKLYNYDTKGIIQLCEAHYWSKVGLLPNCGDYLQMLDELSSSNIIEEVRFYHLNKDDFNIMKSNKNLF